MITMVMNLFKISGSILSTILLIQYYAFDWLFVHLQLLPLQTALSTDPLRIISNNPRGAQPVFGVAHMSAFSFS